MSLTKDVADEQYQLICDQLMEIAEDYNASDEVSKLALAAAQKLTLKFIDNNIEEINTLNSQYKTFINDVEIIIANLEQTTLERLLIGPLKQRLQTAKKKQSFAIVRTSWAYKFKQLIQWLRKRARNKQN